MSLPFTATAMSEASQPPKRSLRFFRSLLFLFSLSSVTINLPFQIFSKTLQNHVRNRGADAFTYIERRSEFTGTSGVV